MGKYMTPAEVAALLQVKVTTLAQWRRRECGPAFVKQGRVVRYHPNAVSAWLAARQVGGDHRAG